MMSIISEERIRSCGKNSPNMKNSPTAVRQDIAIPSLQDVRPSDFLQSLLARFESQMICIVETEVTSSPSQLFGCKSLE